MALVYFDASALVKLVVEEEGSRTAEELWDGCDAALSSRLAYPEVCAALAAAGRKHDLDDAGVTSAIRHLQEFWVALRTVELSPQVERRAGEVAQRHALSGADAVHLASALAIATPELVVAVWDRRLHAGAVAEGIAVAPSTFDD